MTSERGALHDQLDDEGLPLALDEFSHGGVRFESEAACLRRLDLLLEGEAKRIKPARFQPVSIAPFEVEDA